MRWRHIESLRVGLGIVALGVCTGLYHAWSIANPAIVALTMLMVVLVVAAQAARWVAVTMSVTATLAFNFFFLPPVGTLTIADPQNWVVLFTFLAVSLVASHLSAVARNRTHEAVVRRDELARLFDLSRDVLVVTDSHQALASLARSIARRFDLEFVAIAIPKDGEWGILTAGSVPVDLDTRELSHAFAAAKASLEFDAHSRTYAGHRTMVVQGRTVQLVPLRVGARPTGLLAVVGRLVEAGTLDALGGVVALAIERTQFLDDRRAGELARQSDALKTALLASIGHDLKTPLTSIRAAAANLQGQYLNEADRQDQSDLILAEVDRLNRLFQDILEMARIDAGAVAAEFRWVYPSEIVAAARDQVGHALRGHEVRALTADDVPVKLDPRLTAAALARLLENAAQYSPDGERITLQTRLVDDALELQVQDHGPGIAACDLPHVFDRFFRGRSSRSRPGGTGMGLWIARSLLEIEGGRVWADNDPATGAIFTVRVPVEVNAAAAAMDTE